MRTFSLGLFAWLLLLSLASQVAAQEFVSAHIAGQVTASGKPVASASVRWNQATDARVDLSKPMSVMTDAEGRYDLPIWFEGGKALVIREVFADADGFVLAESPGDIPLHRGETAKLDFQLQPGVILAGTLRLPPLAGEATGAKRMLLVSGPALQTRTTNARLRIPDANGKFKTFLPAGEYAFEILGYGSQPVKWTGIKTGREDVILQLQPFEWTEAGLGQAFDELWSEMDRNYSYFFLKKEVDWAALKEKHRPAALKCKNAAELTAALKELLTPLQDLHVSIQTPTGIVPTHQGGFTYNGNRQITLAPLENRTECGKFAIVGRTKPDGFGYFLMVQQPAATAEDVKKAAAAIRGLKGAPGFIVDLRVAVGGNELLAQEIATLFCGQQTVYAKQKYRSGPGHNDFGPVQSRMLAATADAYTKPVVCLIGPGAVSSGEGFVKMMKALPHVTTVGLPTRGASGNPKPFALGQSGVVVNFSRWVDLMPDGKSFEGVGIPPDIEVNLPPKAYGMADPTLDKGLEILRGKVAASGPKK